MEKILSAVAFLSFTLKAIINVLYFDDTRKQFIVYDTELSPAESPLLLCRSFFSLLYTFIFISYCIVKSLRKGEHSEGPNIVSSKFYAAFSASCALEAVYIGVWSRGFCVVAFIAICGACLMQYVAMYLAFTGLYDTMHRNSELSTSTIWYNRILVQSGLIFDCAWNSVLAAINLSVILRYYMGLTCFQASVIGLLVLSIGLFIWFLIENLTVERYVRFTLSEYIAMSIALTSLLSRDRKSESYFPFLLLSVMSAVVILLFLRVFIIICMENRRKNQEQLYTIVTV